MSTKSLVSLLGLCTALLASAEIKQISIPTNSQDASCAPHDQNIWQADAPFHPFRYAIGIGHIISPQGVGWTGFTLHDHNYTAANIPNPARAVVTYHFDQSTVVSQLEIIQHANGVTRVEGFVGDSIETLASIGNVFGPAGDVTGEGILPDGASHVFDFNNTIPGTCFRFEITKTSLADGFAIYRAYPRTPAGERIAGQQPAHILAIADLEVQENTGSATFTVSVTPPADSQIEVDYETTDGTATAGNDYSETTGTLTIPAHASSATFEVPITDDDDPEFAENFRATLSNQRGANAGIERADATCTIAESDIEELAWDDGSADDGTATLTKTNTTATTRWFKVQALPANSGGWRTVLRNTSGNSDIYAAAGFIPTPSNYHQKSDRASGDDGFLLRTDQYTAGQTWYFAVQSAINSSYTLFSGDLFIQDLGTLGFTDTNSNGQYDIGETALPSGSGSVTVKGEGMRFFKARIPVGTPAWSLWLSGDTRPLAVRTATVPYHDSNGRYDRLQEGRMLLVPPYLGTGTDTYYLSVTGNPGDAIQLDSRIQEVEDILFSSNLPGLAVNGPPFRVYRVQVPDDQIAWDVSVSRLTGDPNLAVRQGNVAGEFDNHAFSAAPGSATDGVTLVPDFLTNGTWYITVWGDAPYSFNLYSGDPLITPLAFDSTVVNDQPDRAGWRFYALTDIPSQAGSLGWELELANHVPGTQIALRRNKVPGRWQYRQNGDPNIFDTGVTYTDASSQTGFLQRPGHQADIWYVGIFLPQTPLGAFTLDVHPINPPTVAFNGSNTPVNNLAAGRWAWVRIDVPAGPIGWDLGLANVSGAQPQLVVRRDLLPRPDYSANWGSSPSYATSWPSGYDMPGTLDWTGRTWNAGHTLSHDYLRLVIGMGRPLEPGTYYVGIRNPDPANAVTCTLQSRGIGSGMACPVTTLAFTGGTATVSGLTPREAAYFKVTVPAGAASWEVTLSPTLGEMQLEVRRGTIPDFSASRGGNPQADGSYADLEVEMQKTGPERFTMLPPEGQPSLVAGDYYLAVVSEGENPVDVHHTGTGTSNGQITSHGALAVTNLGTASLAGIGEHVSLAAGQIRAYSFTVPADTASLEVRLDNRVAGTPWLSVMPGDRLPRPFSPYYTWVGYERYGFAGGQESGVSQDDNLITIANPAPGAPAQYRLLVRAAASPDDPNSLADASADLNVVAVTPVPVAFDGGSSSISSQAPTAWRYFEVTVPNGIAGWDARLENVGGGTPQLVVCRGTLPAGPGTSPGWPGSSPAECTAWPLAERWSESIDWTNRGLQANGEPVNWRRLVMGSGRPLEPGTYYVGVYNSDPANPASYTFRSLGIGSGQSIPVTNLAFSGGTTNLTGLAPREAAYFKVTIPANTPSWELTLDPSLGEMLMAIRRGAIPDFAAPWRNDIQQDYGSREVRVQKIGPERHVLLPLQDGDSLVAGDYYVAVIAEGQSPFNSGYTGSGTCDGVLTSVGTLAVANLGTPSTTSSVLPLNLAGGQTTAYEFNVAPDTAAVEIRIDDRDGEPWMTVLPGSRPPRPIGTWYTSYGHESYGYGGGQTSGYITDESLITLANPLPGPHRLILHASSRYDDMSSFPAATGDLTVTRLITPDLAFDGGASAVSAQLQTSWRFFRVVVPDDPDLRGWDVRIRNVTGGDPQLTVRRDLLPDRNNSGTPWPGDYPSGTNYWPSGAAWGQTFDWTGLPGEAGSTDWNYYRRFVAARGMPLEPGTYYLGVYNLEGRGEASYVIESRAIGNGMTIPVATLGFATSDADITDLAPREAVYFKVTVPNDTPNWEFTLDQSVGESLLVARRGFIPDPTSPEGGDMQYDYGNRAVRVGRTGPERYVLLPGDNQDAILAGDYFLAVVSQGVNPSAYSIGTGLSSSTLHSIGNIAVTDLGTATTAGSTTTVNLLATQLKAYSFTVDPGTSRVDVRLDNRIGYPVVSLVPGNRIARPYAAGMHWGESYGHGGGQVSGGWSFSAELLTLTDPAPGTYSVVVRASGTPYARDFVDAEANLVVQAQLPPEPDHPDPLNFAASMNGNGQSHTDTRQLADGQKAYYAVEVPTTLDGNDVIGWKIRVDHSQGDTTMRVFKTWGQPASGATVTDNIAVIVPPFLTPGDIWHIELQATGLTNYTITSEPVVLARPAWTMSTGHNSVFGDTGTDQNGDPLPGDRGTDLGNSDWHFYAVDIPDGNAGLLRTELQAINGDPNLYIREDGVPTTDHSLTPPSPGTIYHRSLTGTGSEYGNWVPVDGRLQRQLPPGRWHFGVKASGTSNARYRLILSTGQVTDLDLTSGNAANQILVGKDWRYYRFQMPSEAPATWNLTFSQQLGDVVMWLRDTVPPGNRSSGEETYDQGSWGGLVSWYADAKNQGPYSYTGHDAAGSYSFDTPPLRPGNSYYVGFRAATDSTFSLTSSTTGTIGTIPEIHFYGGSVTTTIPVGEQRIYQVIVPHEATRWRHSTLRSGNVQVRVENGSLPTPSGSVHFAEPAWSPGLSILLNNWPMLPDFTYFVMLKNEGTEPEEVTFSMDGRNAITDDEDQDGLPDAWENEYFGNYWSQDGSGDPDRDGKNNQAEHNDITDPTDPDSALYPLSLAAIHGTADATPAQPVYNSGASVTLHTAGESGTTFQGWRNGPFRNGEFAVRATGTVTIPADGVWTFGACADDGVRLKVDGSTVIESDGATGTREAFGGISLTAGDHVVEVVHFQNGFESALELFAAAGDHSSFNPSFRLVGDTGNGGLAVTTDPGGGSVDGFSVRHVLSRDIGLWWLSDADVLLAGEIGSSADTTSVCPVLNFLAFELGDGRFADNLAFPLFAHIANPDAAITVRDAHVLTAVHTVPFAQALETTGVTWQSGGSMPWYAENSGQAADATDHARSGPISDYARSTLRAVVTGPGQLGFHWKVSSQENVDLYTFLIDGVVQATISGEVAWQTASYSLPAGTHTLEWTYAKDPSISAGEDAAWLDQVTFTTGTTYQSWASSRFDAEQLADPAVSGQNADPAGDKIPNLLKYASNLEPWTHYSGASRRLTPGTGLQGLPNITRTGGVLRVEYLRRLNANGLHYTVQFSSNLTNSGSGSWAAATGPEEITPINADWERVVVQDIPPPGATRRFGRVVVSQD